MDACAFYHVQITYCFVRTGVLKFSLQTDWLIEGERIMCRNIRPLFNFEPPVTEDEVRAAALQYVRKVSGFSKPSKANEEAFLAAVEEIAAATHKLMSSLETNAPPKDREEVAAKARIRAAQRFAR